MLNKISVILMLRLLGIFLSFITVVSITQNFGEEKIGLYFYANSVIAIVSCIFKFGTDKLIIKHNFKNSDIKGYFKDLLLKVYSFTSIITLIIAALICEYQDNLNLVYLFIAIIAQALLYLFALSQGQGAQAGFIRQHTHGLLRQVRPQSGHVRVAQAGFIWQDQDLV